MKKNLSNKIQEYIIDCIWSEDHADFRSWTKRQKVQHLHDTFVSEYGWKGTTVYQIKSWFQGLPSSINFVFYNTDILDLAIKWGVLTENSTDDEEWKVIHNYFYVMAVNAYKLFKELEKENSEILDK